MLTPKIAKITYWLKRLKMTDIANVDKSMQKLDKSTRQVSMAYWIMYQSSIKLLSHFLLLYTDFVPRTGGQIYVPTLNHQCCWYCWLSSLPQNDVNIKLWTLIVVQAKTCPSNKYDAKQPGQLIAWKRQLNRVKDDDMKRNRNCPNVTNTRDGIWAVIQYSSCAVSCNRRKLTTASSEADFIGLFNAFPKHSSTP